MIKKIILMIFGFLVAAGAALPQAQAACSGAGTVWNCDATSTSNDLQGAVNSAPDGATITLANGTYSFTSYVSFSSSKGVTVICATVGGCTINLSGPPAFGVGLYSGGPFTGLYRMSGFVFNQVPNGWPVVVWGFSSDYNTGTFTRIRIDHNTFNLSKAVHVFQGGPVKSIGHFYGVIDHNIVNNLNTDSSTLGGSSMIVYITGATDPSQTSSESGTINNMFVEDNQITWATSPPGGDGCTDSWGGANVVYRFNTSTNCQIATHGQTHSGGPANWEVYGNDIRVTNNDGQFGDGYRLFHHQGSGELTIFNNKLTPFSTPHNGDPLAIMQYRDIYDTPTAVTQITVSGGVATLTGSFSGMPGVGYPAGWLYLQGFSNPGNNGNFMVTSYTATSAQGPAAPGMVTETAPAGAVANIASHDGGAPVCDGTVTAAYGGIGDGNRQPTSTYRGYPCWRQPGRDFAGNLKPMYAWGNFWGDDGTSAPFNVEAYGDPVLYSDHFKENRDYYRANSLSPQTSPSSPFNGSVGLGIGTLVNRPATCTPTSEAADTGNGGVGYWATDQGRWMTAAPSQGYWPAGQQGTLFTCVFIGGVPQWVKHYTPFTYPHPLVTGTAGPSLAPAKPSGLALR